MLDRAADTGRATGLVTSAQVWSDTPAGFAVHLNEDDDGEFDNDTVLRDMVDNPDVGLIMGTGHPEFNNDGNPKGSYFGGNVPRDVWNDLDNGDDGWTLIEQRSEFQELATADEPPARVFGMAQTDGTLQHDRPGERAEPFATPLLQGVPRLPEMASGALNVLRNTSEAGLFLMVEAATVDHSGHAGELGRTIEEMVAFDETVDAVSAWVGANGGWEQNLVVVTSDHETGHLWGAGSCAAQDFRPLTGEPGEPPAAEFCDFTDGAPGDENPHYHTNALVPLFAQGAGAQRFADYVVGSDPAASPRRSHDWGRRRWSSSAAIWRSSPRLRRSWISSPRSPVWVARRGMAPRSRSPNGSASPAVGWCWPLVVTSPTRWPGACSPGGRRGRCC